MSFPQTRLRRLRRLSHLRDMVRETRLSVDQLVYPMFVCHGESVRNAISSMPGCYQLSIDNMVEEATEAEALGISSVLLFGIPAEKDPKGSEAYADDGIIPTAIRALKESLPGMLIWADVCMCEYTSHGHCGILSGEEVDNDNTLDWLALAATVYARAGADVIAPSDMMDGRVGAIRKALDGAGYQMTPICSYAAKYASAFYGPFREAAESTPQFGDRRGYQMDPANAEEALREVALDVEEGADMIIIKPAMAYGDIIWRVKDRFKLPVAAYNVSGEYSMIKAAAEMGWIDEQRVMMETLTGIARSGADIIITYFAKDAAHVLNGK